MLCILFTLFQVLPGHMTGVHENKVRSVMFSSDAGNHNLTRINMWKSQLSLHDAPTAVKLSMLQTNMHAHYVSSVCYKVVASPLILRFTILKVSAVAMLMQIV